MKATTLLAIFFLLCLSLTPKGECASRGNLLPPVVLDIYGNEVNGDEYYNIESPFPDVLYTVSPLPNPNGTCWVQIETRVPLITLHSSLPIRFRLPVIGYESIIREDTLIDIEFFDRSLLLHRVCGGSLWTVHEEYEPVFGQRFVNVGGKEEYGTIWFKIVRAEHLPGNTYHLQFCPYSFDCQYLGVFWDAEGIGCLALAKDSPFPFAFSPLYRSQ